MSLISKKYRKLYMWVLFLFSHMEYTSCADNYLAERNSGLRALSEVNDSVSFAMSNGITPIGDYLGQSSTLYDAKVVSGKADPRRTSTRVLGGYTTTSTKADSSYTVNSTSAGYSATTAKVLPFRRTAQSATLATPSNVVALKPARKPIEHMFLKTA